MIKKWRRCYKVEDTAAYQQDNTATLPLLYFSLTEKETEQATQEIMLMIQNLKKYVIEREKQFCMLVNTEELGRPAASVVMRIVEFMKEVRPYAQSKMLGSVIVIPNAFIRGLVNMCFTIQPPTTPVKVVASMDNVKNHLIVTEPL